MLDNGLDDQYRPICTPFPDAKGSEVWPSKQELHNLTLEEQVRQAAAEMSGLETKSIVGSSVSQCSSSVATWIKQVNEYETRRKRETQGAAEVKKEHGVATSADDASMMDVDRAESSSVADVKTTSASESRTIDALPKGMFFIQLPSHLPMTPGHAMQRGGRPPGSPRLSPRLSPRSGSPKMMG